MKNRFDLEQEILDCWGVTTDIDDVYEYVGNLEHFKHQDDVMNMLLGIKTLYDVKFDKMFRTFETCIKNKGIK